MKGDGFFLTSEQPGRGPGQKQGSSRFPGWALERRALGRAALERRVLGRRGSFFFLAGETEGAPGAASGHPVRWV